MSSSDGSRHAVYGNVPLKTHRRVLAILKREKITMSTYITNLVLVDVDRRDQERKAARTAKKQLAARDRE